MTATPSDVQLDPGTANEAPRPDAPYRGIESFRFIDQQIFAARDEEIWALVSNVTLYRAVLLYGDSGTGKSSLINAGLLPQALAENYVPDRLRVQPLVGRELKVERIKKSGTEDSAEYLPSNFATSESQRSAESMELSLAAFRERLEQFRAASNSQPGDEPFGEPANTPLPLLIFDQFEEFITLFEEAQRTEARKTSSGEFVGLPPFTAVPSVQENLLRMFVELIRDHTLPVKIVLSFREDYLAKLSLLFDYCPELHNQAQRLLPPHVKNLPLIIRAPFKDAALSEHFRQHSGGRSELTETLAAKISAELSRRSENDRANLTELQIVCQRLWEAPDPEALFAKGIEGILDSYGDDVIDDFTPAQRDAAIVLLSHLITGSDTRNIISEEDLLTGAQRTLDGGEARPQTLREALKALSDSQIVRRERRRDIYFYEITSEYLVPWIKKRVAARQAEVERDQARKAQQELEARRRDAEARFRKEQQRVRKAVIFSVALALLLAGTAVLGVLAYRSYDRADQAKKQALDEKDTTKRVVNAVTSIYSNDRTKALAGVTELDKLIKEGRISSEQKRILLAAVLTNPDLEVKKAALKVALYAIDKDDDPDLRAAVVRLVDTDLALRENLSGGAEKNFNNLSKSLPTRLYIHIADESQRETAQRVAAKLKELNYIVPATENAAANSPLANELRYFSKDDSGTEAFTDIVAVLQTATGEKWDAKYVRGYASSPGFQPGHMEIWFGSGSVTTLGQLRAYPVDEHGNFVPHLKMRFVITDSTGKVVRRRTGYVQLPPGDYDMTVTIEGYQTINQKFSLQRGKENELPFKVTKNNND